MRKRNLLAKAARLENLSPLHNRIKIPPNFARAVALFGLAPGATSFPQVLPSGSDRESRARCRAHARLNIVILPIRHRLTLVACEIDRRLLEALPPFCSRASMRPTTRSDPSSTSSSETRSDRKARRLISIPISRRLK